MKVKRENKIVLSNYFTMKNDLVWTVKTCLNLESLSIRNLLVFSILPHSEIKITINQSVNKRQE